MANTTNLPNESCSTCHSRIDVHSRWCPGCSADVGFPNVRAASRHEETDALIQRWEDAEISANSKKCEPILHAFEASVKQSKAVINKSAGEINPILSGDNILYSTFYHAIDGQSRLPENNFYDMARGPTDSTLFPYYYKEMRFAALSLDGRGVQKFGALTMVLREHIIKHRATVFEENSVEFCARHKITIGSPIPLGYRTVWDKRHQLAAAKLHSKLTAQTVEEDFPEILLQPGTKTADADFIEVHIYGSLNNRGIERIVGKLPKNKPDRVLVESWKSKIEGLGVILDIT